MNEKEAQKVLDELQNVRPEVLNGEAKRLFEAIMKIADERDLLKDQKEYVINEYGRTIEKQSKMIDLMAEQLTSPINGKEWVIKYYEDRVENEKNV